MGVWKVVSLPDPVVIISPLLCAEPGSLNEWPLLGGISRLSSKKNVFLAIPRMLIRFEMYVSGVVILKLVICYV